MEMIDAMSSQAEVGILLRPEGHVGDRFVRAEVCGSHGNRSIATQCEKVAVNLNLLLFPREIMCPLHEPGFGPI